jgi:hypothetical protein
MKNNKLWFAVGMIVMFAACLIYFKSCVKPVIVNKPVITTVTDTLWQTDTIALIKYKPTVHDSVRIIIIDTSLCSYSRLYQDSIIEKNYNLYYIASTTGRLDFITAECILKVPLIVENTVIKYDTLTKLNDFKRNFFYGCQISTPSVLNNKLGIVPSLLYQNEKKGYCVSVGYDLVNSTYNASVFFNFKKQK